MSGFRSKQLLLLLAILILPSIAIALLAWRDVTRESARRQKESEERVRSEIRDEVLKALNEIVVLEISGKPAGPALAFTGRVEKNGLVFPWDTGAGSAAARNAVNASEFRRAVIDAGRAEHVDKRFDLAAAHLRELMQRSRNESQRLAARSLLAGSLLRSGAPEARTEGIEIWRDILNRPSSEVNEYGIPYAYIAAGALASVAGDETLERVTEDPGFPSLVSPAGVHALSPVLEALRHSSNANVASRAASVLEQLSARIAFLKQAEALRTDFSSRFSLVPSHWRSYPLPSAAAGAELWIIGLTQETPPRAIAVRASEILRRVAAEHRPRDGDPLFEITSGGAGDSMGENLPDLRIRLLPAARPGLRPAISQAPPALVVALVSVVLLTFVGGYLLWRDTRREIRLADLRTQFVASVSHELKTPLTAIRMFAELMQLQGPSIDVKKHHEHLAAIVSESERLSRLLNNVLAFSQIERGQKLYNMAPTTLSEVVEASARAMRFPLAQRGFRFRMDIADGVPKAQVDRDAIEQAVLNLLSNAMKYSGEGRDILLRLFAENGDAAIQVSDCGVGIPPEEHRRIFERFYRVSTPENLAVSGAGLGLSLVEHIAEVHGGRVDVESAVGQGSTFTIRIPLMESGEPLMETT